MVGEEPGIRIEPTGTMTTRSGWRFAVAPPAGWRWAPTTCLACRSTALRTPWQMALIVSLTQFGRYVPLITICRLNRVADFVVPYWVVMQVVFVVG